MKLQRALHPNFLKRLQHMVFLGKVVGGGANEKTFLMQCLSPVPRPIREAASNLEESFFFSGSCGARQNEKILRAFPDMKASLFLFRLRYANKQLQAELIAGKEGEPAHSYELVPVPHLSAGQMRDVLERKLCKGYVSFLLPRYISDFGMPGLLYCQNRLYGNLSLKSTVNSIMYREQRREATYYEVEDWHSYAAWNVDDMLYFVQSDYYDMLKKETEQQGKRLTMPETKQRFVPAKAEDNGEAAFLENLQKQTREGQLFIEATDIINFHTCLKTGRMTIVGGMPGIGKSRFVKLYAEALGLRYGQELLWVPVSPSFQEPQDLLGYSHPNGTYVASDTGLVPLLLQAQQQPGQLYMVVFDEMNISHIEYWFTPFLSLLELEAKDRILTLHALEGETGVPAHVKIGRNVIFVGTVNFDETTKELSDRLLDRVNIVTFQKQSFREAFTAEDLPDESRRGLHIHSFTFQDWGSEYTIASFTDEELELLDALHQCLQKHDAAKGVSFRTAASIGAYLSNLPKDAEGELLLSRDEAFDLQIKQRVLTKIRGMEHAIAPLIQEKRGKEGALLELLQSPLAQDVSAFAHSLALLRQKARELELYGYAK